MSVLVHLSGRAYHILCAEADARKVTVPAITRALIKKIAMGDFDEMIKGLDLNEFGNPSHRKKPYGQVRKQKLYEWQGNKHTVAELSRLTAIPHTTIYMRLKRGMRLETALTLPPQTRSKEFTTICRLHDKPPRVVRERLKLGWDFERALTTAVKRGAP